MITTSSKLAHGIRKGYRSGLEEKISEQIAGAGLQVEYETDKISYVWPERNATYKPDFKLPKVGGFFYVETKGRFVVSDRQKQILIKEQRPDLDIRFVFSRASSPLYKGSPTTYADWCNKHGFLFANKIIPEEWLKEANDNESAPENS